MASLLSAGRKERHPLHTAQCHDSRSLLLRTATESLRMARCKTAAESQTLGDLYEKLTKAKLSKSKSTLLIKIPCQRESILLFNASRLPLVYGQDCGRDGPTRLKPLWPSSIRYHARHYCYRWDSAAPLDHTLSRVGARESARILLRRTPLADPRFESALPGLRLECSYLAIADLDFTVSSGFHRIPQCIGEISTPSPSSPSPFSYFMSVLL
ncbi:hypothetical protein GGS23DRAFT_40956 [Durotheca rogersii]|uniref:uncharacterized protein n=1 Tax=Durotheca rogersii TaxID=419775 RepID=UPI00221EAFDF|nr:uncharacterized protein GGS23DRAFT_40956 [Durotheca rogersii]KAI5868632.1 hypothetical protein GGS23DRAFT_40956 [Durotheca rogersii]